MEHIGDNIVHLSECPNVKKIKLDKKILMAIQQELSRSITYLIGKSGKIFIKLGQDDVSKIKALIEKQSDKVMSNYLDNIFRYVIDIQEELVNIYFYKKLINDKML